MIFQRDIVMVALAIMVAVSGVVCCVSQAFAVEMNQLRKDSVSKTAEKDDASDAEKADKQDSVQTKEPAASTDSADAGAVKTEGEEKTAAADEAQEKTAATSATSEKSEAPEKTAETAEGDTSEKSADTVADKPKDGTSEELSEDANLANMTEGAETEEECAEPLPVVAFDSIDALQGVLPRKTEAYEIQPDVKISGPYYRFHVVTDHGDYEIDSIVKLLKVCYEIHVIEAYRREFHASPVIKGSVDAVKGMGQGAINIVLRPGQSLKGMTRMISRLGRGAADIGMTPLVDQPVSDTGENREAIPAGLLFPKQSRQFAYEQDLDVYSDNPYVRDLIAAVAKRLGAGRWAVKITAKYFAPVPYIGTATRGALTPGERNEEIDILIMENGPRELYRLLFVMYRDLFGLSDDEDAPQEVKDELQCWYTFLHNPNFSPREKAYSYCYLRDMKCVSGRADAVRMLAEIKKIRDAMLAARQLELLAALHINGPVSLARLVPGKTMLAARTDADGIVFIAPYDVVDEVDRMRDLRLWLKDEAKASDAANIDFWAVGTITPQFREAAAEDGVDVLDGILGEPEFRTERMKKLCKPLLEGDDDKKETQNTDQRRGRVPLEEKVSPNPPKLPPEQWIVS